MFKSQLKALSLIVFSSLVVSQSYSADDSKKLEVSESAFKCISALAASGRFFVDNILGNLDATLAVANSNSGGNYPPGSLLTLVPDEAMIKHQQGWNPATNDWEFFLLDLSAEGASISARGGAEVASSSGSCFGCHQLARPSGIWSVASITAVHRLHLTLNKFELPKRWIRGALTKTKA